MGRTKAIGAAVLVWGAVLWAGVPRAEAIPTVTPLTNFNTTVDVVNTGGGPGQNITGWTVDGTQEYATPSAGSFWTYRVNGGAMASLSSLTFVSSTITSPSGNPFDFSPTTLTTVYQDVAHGLQFTTSYQITGGDAGSGTSKIQTQMSVSLIGGSATSVDIFELNNMDLTGTAGNDVVRTRPADAGRTVIQSDLSTTFGEGASFKILTGGDLTISDPTAREADLASVVAAAVASGLLTNTPAPGTAVGPGDVGYAYQYSFALAPGTPAASVELDLTRSVNLAKIWTGGAGVGDTNFTTPANWTGSILPTNDIFTDVAVFPIKDSLTNPTLNTSYSLYGVYFADAGWNINGTGTLTLGASGILSTGAGTNTISVANLVQGSSMYLDVLTGNTLNISSQVDLGTFTLTKTDAGIANLTGAVVGTGNIVVDGGTLGLSGNNTFTGGVTLDAGTLNIGSATALGAGTFTINGGTFDNTSGSALTLTSNNAQQWNGSFTFVGTKDLNLGTGAVALGNNVTVTANGSTLAVGGNITGGFGLTKAGAGALTLSGNNGFTGGVTLNAGTLNINSATALGTGLFAIFGGSIDNTSGAALTLTTNNPQAWNSNFTFVGTRDLNLGTGAVTLGNNVTVTANGSTLAVGGDITGSFGLTKAGAGALTLSGDNDFTGGVTLNAGTLNINSATALGAGQFTINGGAIDNTSGAALTLTTNNPISLSGNFTFAGSNALDLGAGAVTLVGSRTVTVTASTLTIGGTIDETGPSALTVNGGGTLLLTGTNAFTGATTIGAGATVQLGNGGATGSIDTTTGVTDNGTLVFNHSDNVIFAPIISGTGSVTQSGTGALTLSGGNTFAGGVTLNSGTLDINSANSIGTGTLTINGGAIDNTSGGALVLSQNNAEIWNGNFTFLGSNTLDLGTGPVTLGNNVTVTVNASNLIVNGNIGGAFGLTKAGGGAGALTLAGDNTFTGGVTLIGGGLNINSATALGTGTFTINGGVIDNTSAADLVLTTNNTQAWNGDFVFAGSNALDLGTGAVALNGNHTVTVNQSTLTVGGPISGTGFGLTVAGGGTLVLGADNTYTGATTIATGATLQLGTGGPSGSVASSGITDNGTLVFDRSDAVTFSKVISGTGTLQQIGNAIGGKLTLTGANTYTGETTIGSGAELEIGNGTTVGTINSTSDVVDNGLIIFNHSDNLSFNKVISGTGDLFQSGTGTLTLNAVNTYAGLTVVSAGTLAISNGNSITSNTSVNGVGTLNLLGTINGTLTSSGIVTGTGRVTGTTHITGGSITPGGTAIGTLTTGTFTLDPATTYKVDFDFGAGTADKIVVNGSAELGAGSIIQLHQQDLTFITTNKNFTVLTTTGGLTDDGVLLQSAPSQFFHLTGSIANNDNFVVTVNRVSFASLATAGNNRAIATALDVITAQGPAADSDIITLLNGLEGLSTADFNAALNALSPEFFGAPTDVTVQGIHRYHQSLADFLSERRSDEPVLMTESTETSSIPFNTNGLANAMAAPLPVAMATNVEYRGDSTAIGADDGMGRNNDFDVFVRPFGLFGNRTGTTDRLGYHYNTEGFTAGFDRKLTVPWIVVGVAGGYNHSNLDYSQNRGTTDGDSLRAGPFISFVFHPGPIEQWFVDMSVTGGYHWVDSNRMVAGPSITPGTASANYEAYDMAAYLATGFKVPGTGKFNILPTAAIDYDFYHHEGFTETGGPTGTNLSIQADGISSLQSSLGVRVQYRAMAGSVTLVPEVSVAWIHDFLHQNDITASFANTNAPFTVGSGLNATDGARFGAALNAIVTKRISAFLRYDGEVQSHHNNHMVSAGVDIGF